MIARGPCTVNDCRRHLTHIYTRAHTHTITNTHVHRCTHHTHTHHHMVHHSMKARTSRTSWCERCVHDIALGSPQWSPRHTPATAHINDWCGRVQKKEGSIGGMMWMWSISDRLIDERIHSQQQHRMSSSRKRL